MTRNDSFHPLTLDPRSAGKISRYHTWERIRDQSVGEHTWQVMRIILALHPEASPQLLRYAMFHDVGERVTGDVPFPVKREHPEVKTAFDSMEGEAQLRMVPWGVIAGVVLTVEERNLLKLAEFIEMMEWGLDEMALGNKNARIIFTRCLAQAQQYTRNPLPSRVHIKAETYINRRLQHEQRYRGLRP